MFIGRAGICYGEVSVGTLGFVIKLGIDIVVF